MAEQTQPQPQPQQQPEEQLQQQPAQQPEAQAQISEAMALRLLNSVMATTGSATSQTIPVTTAQVSNPQHAPSLPASSDAGGQSECIGGVVGGATGIAVETVGVEDVGAAGAGTSTSTSCDDGTGLTLPAPMSPSRPGQTSQGSVHSTNEQGNLCRICRWNRSDMEIINCPCKCKGSVGYIHLKCLKQWIMHRRENRCEICNAPFNITADRASVKQMVRAFCCGRCCGMILKHVLFSASLMPLAHVILQQVLHCMDNLNQGTTEQLTVQEVFVASCALLTSSALFFHFFEFVTTRFLLIRNILRHWWIFGSTNDFGLVDVEDDIFDLF